MSRIALAEVAARTLGVDVGPNKLAIFTVSEVYASVAGSHLALITGPVTPDVCGRAPILLDPILSTIVALKRDGLTILLVEQNASAAPAIADRGCVIETRQVTAAGTVRPLLANDRVKAAYPGL